jgi:hypothetical protein
MLKFNNENYNLTSKYAFEEHKSVAMKEKREAMSLKGTQ